MRLLEAAAAAAKSLQSCPTPPGSPVPGILQARTLEWLPFPSPVHKEIKHRHMKQHESNYKTTINLCSKTSVMRAN